MKYILQEPIITTIEEKEIADEKQIKELLKNLFDKQQSFSMTFRDEDHSDVIKKYEKVRISSINETGFACTAFFKDASMRCSNISYSNMLNLRVIASRNDVAKRYKVSRWHLLDVAEID